MTTNDLLVDALAELKVARAGGGGLPPANAELALRRLNILLDFWNANGRAAYDTSFSDFTLTPAHSPHTIGAAGSGADFIVSVGRPVALVNAQLNIGTLANPVFVPLTVRDDAWYARQSVPTITMAVMRDVYYARGWPLGSLYFWGIPTVAYRVRLWLRTLLANITDPTAELSLPQGYAMALYLSLAENCASAFGQSVSADLATRASEARALIFGNNDGDMTLDTADAGLQQAGGGGFNWLARDSS